jgi:hypothetical protein
MQASCPKEFRDKKPIASHGQSEGQQP